MKKQGEYRFGIGVPTLLMLCVILALTTLGVLTYAAGRADLSLTDRTVDMTRAYYEAAARAQESLSRLDAELVYMRKRSGSESEYANMLQKYAGENGMTLENGVLSFSLDAGGERQLMLAARVSPLSDTGARYTLVRHALTGDAFALEDEEKTLNLYH